MEKLDISSWAKLKNKTRARDTVVQAAESAAQAARLTIGMYCVALGGVAA